MSNRNWIVGVLVAVILLVIAFQWLEKDEPDDVLRDATDATSDAIRDAADDIKDGVR